MVRPKRLLLVMAHWCPHCYPLSVEWGKRLAQLLQVPLIQLDIDVASQEKQADRLVEAHGDFTADYLIPQVFLEREDGSVEHLLTGIPGSVEATEQAWARLLDRFSRSQSVEEGQEELTPPNPPGEHLRAAR